MKRDAVMVLVHPQVDGSVVSVTCMPRISVANLFQAGMSLTPMPRYAS